MATNTTDATYSYTLKDGRGDLFAVRGMDWDEFYDNLFNVLGSQDRIAAVLAEIRERVDGGAVNASSGPSGGSRNSGGGTGTGGGSGRQNGSQGHSRGDGPQGDRAPHGGQRQTEAPRGGKPDGGEGPHCAHGPMNFRQYEKKSGPNAGNTEQTWFCPQPREVPTSEKCSPIDASTMEPWYS